MVGENIYCTLKKVVMELLGEKSKLAKIGCAL